MAPTSAAWPLIGRKAELDSIRTLLGLRGTKGVIVHGLPGVGKTRLVEAACEEFERNGGRVFRVVATADAAGFPLAALAPLLASRLAEHGDLPRDPVRLLAVMQEVTGASNGRARPLLFVDDLPFLDPLSAVVISQLVESGSAILVATVRTGDPLPEMYRGRWSGDGIAKIELPPLTQQECGAVLSRALSAPVASRSVDRLHAMSRGIPLHLRALVSSAQADGSFRLVEGVWQLSNSPIRNPALEQILQERIATLDPAATNVLRRIAICQPLELDDVSEDVTAQLVELENAQLIQVDQDAGGEWMIRLAHPAYADLIRGGVSRLQARTILLDQAAAVRMRGRGSRDVVRLCMWELEATGRADPAVLIAAARLAREEHEFELVRRLAAAAVDSAPDPSGEALLLLGEALRELGDAASAESVLDRAAASPAPAELLGRVAIIRAGLVCHSHNRPDLAAALLAEARDALPGQEAAMSLARSVMLTVGEDVDSALSELESVDPDRAHSVDLAGLYLLAGVGAMIAAGRPAEGLRLADELLPILSTRGNLMHDGMPSMLRASALLDLHGPDRALLDATTALRQCLDSGLDRLVCYAESQLFTVRLAAGQVRTAARWAREVISVARNAQQRSFVSVGMSNLALASAMAGESDRAQAILDQLAAENAEHSGRPGPAPSWELRACAWTAAGRGELGRACEILADAATSAAGRGHWQAAAALWHDIVRLGAADRGAAGLRAAAERCPSPLVRLQQRHAMAAAADDPDELSAVGEEWAGNGWRLVAAEAHLAAATAARRRGASRRVGALTARATELAADCQGATTPGLQLGASVDPLSPREREIAAMASQGLRSREIADSLVVSIRTVDNHLQAVYGKLGIAGRRELADALRIG